MRALVWGRVRTWDSACGHVRTDVCGHARRGEGMMASVDGRGVCGWRSTLCDMRMALGRGRGNRNHAWHARALGGSGRGALSRLEAHVSHRPAGFFVGAVCVFLCAVILVLPSPYVVESPGPTRNVLGSSEGTAVITVKGASTYKDSGKLLMVTVNASGVPGYAMTTAEAMISWFRSDSVVTPTETVFPVGQSADEYRSESTGQMTQSQNHAVTAALSFASKNLGVDVSDVSVSLNMEDVGGPSAGMMYALGILDKLGSTSLTNGAVIAGTGTMSDSGKVGAIGGIRLKMLGARRDAATWFLAPKSNCDEVVGHVPSGLRDVRVSTLSDAYKALIAISSGKGDSLPRCQA